jgi:hypothetical protein
LPHPKTSGLKTARFRGLGPRYGGFIVKEINRIIERIRTGKNMSRRELAEKMGAGITKEQIDKHFENDSVDAWRIARMCEIFSLPTMPAETFLNERPSDD